MFNDGKYEEAVVTYTHSLRISPVYSKHAALAYAQRSAASFNLRAFKECIMDIDRALDLPYPDHLRKQIENRRASATIMLHECTDQVMQTNPPVVEYEYAHGENSKIPGASRGLEIAYDPVGDERILVAKLPFKEGDVMAVLKPYLVVPEMEEHPTFCHHCLKKSFFILPCDTCNYEVYCSEKCRAEAFRMYHRLECKIQYTLVCSLPLNRHLLACQMRCLSIFSKQGTDLKGLRDDMKEIESSSGSRFYRTYLKCQCRVFKSLIIQFQISPRSDSPVKSLTETQERVSSVWDVTNQENTIPKHCWEVLT